MHIRRQTITAFLLTLISLPWLTGTGARADDAAPHADGVFAESAPQRDLFADELQKRRLAEERAAICDQPGQTGQSAQTGRAGQGEFARASGAEPAFPRFAEPPRTFHPRDDADAPGPSAFVLVSRP